jgi:beta-glucosidase
MVVRASGYLFDHQILYPAWEPPQKTLRHWISDLGVGGVILLGGSAAEVGLRSQQLQDWASVPLLIAADIEEGVGQRFSGATWFPPPMALGAMAQQNWPEAIAQAEQMGRVTAREALTIGINWLLGPVVDVNNNPDNPVINIRAFGDHPEIVQDLSMAFLRGTQAFPILTAAKHFPGHGDTATDSHLVMPVLPHSVERLAQVELPPFEAAITAGVDAVMTAHLQLPVLDGDYPATLSARILTDLLRKQMQFDGLIVTDALIMGAIADHYGADEAVVLAVEAGADIVLMPANPPGAIAALERAVETGRIPPGRIHASLERIWRAKYRVYAPAVSGGASHAWESIPPPAIDLDLLSCADAIATVKTILKATTCVHLPEPTPSTCNPQHSTRRNLVLVDNLLQCPFLDRQAAAVALPAEQGYQLCLVDRHTPTAAFSTDDQKSQATLLQLFIRGNPFGGSAAQLERAICWLDYLVQTEQLIALAVYGSPYALDTLLSRVPPDLPHSYSYGQMPAAQAIALPPLLKILASTQTCLDPQFTT